MSKKSTTPKVATPPPEKSAFDFHLLWQVPMAAMMIVAISFFVSRTVANTYYWAHDGVLPWDLYPQRVVQHPLDGTWTLEYWEATPRWIETRRFATEAEAREWANEKIFPAQFRDRPMSVSKAIKLLTSQPNVVTNYVVVTNVVDWEYGVALTNIPSANFIITVD